MRVIWDQRRSQANRRKHGVSFEEAASVLFDPFALDALDHADPARTLVIGMSARSRLPFVVTPVIDEDDVVRIISAAGIAIAAEET